MPFEIHWYYDKQGVSQGPLTEAAMIDLMQRKQLGGETLIWRPGLESWASLREVQPEWLKIMPSAEAAKPAFKKLPQQPGLPVDSTPPTPLAKPKAGIEGETTGKEKKGLLQRLFGKGKSK